jgi:serine/threonine-protein kinase
MNKIGRLCRYIKKSKNIIKLDLGEIRDLITVGQGGNGIVYSGNLFGETIALKFLTTEFTGDSLDTKTRRFLAEYYNIITLDNSTGIVKYINYDILKFEDKEGCLEIPVILMKKYDTSLANFIDTPSEKGFLNLFEFLLNTLEKIHSKGIIHRDIKPENILVDKSNFVLADFGIASYNPEMFQILPKTGKDERIGNRLFSAPEQESKSIVANTTMDIYALGQVLQWYATGCTHKGTQRQRLTSVFSRLEVYDAIIEKCLANDPKKRFQNVSEIRDFISSCIKKQYYEYLDDFNLILRQNYPSTESGVIISSDKSRIDKLFSSFKEKENSFDSKLVYHNGKEVNAVPFRLRNIELGIWRFGTKEYSIKDICLYYDSSHFNDFLMVHYDKSVPFNVNGKEVYQTVIVNNIHHISLTEESCGFAEIDGVILDLSQQDVEIIERQEEEGYFFIATQFHCVCHRDSDSIIVNLIKEIQDNNEQMNANRILDFQSEIRMNKHLLVLENL